MLAIPQSSSAALGREQEAADDAENWDKGKHQQK